jgi:hypothetical protein
MATYCNQCGGTGQTVNNKFCKCIQGKLMQRMSDAREKEIQARAEREKKEAEGKAKIKAYHEKVMAANEIDLEKMVEENLNQFNFELGQWVVVKGVVGTISNIDGASRKVKVIGHYHQESRKPFDGSNGWIDFGKVEPAPLEGFDDVSLPMFLTDLEQRLNIDYALRTGNKELFMELTDHD